MNIGIDKIGFFTPGHYVEMADLATARGVDPNKFIIGLGQEQMAVPYVYEDAVTLAAAAAQSILTDEDKEQIDLILVGSESGVDNSKAIAVYMQSLLGLSHRVRAVELKQACYGATMGLQLAKGHVALNPNSKVLVIASDIAKYGLNTPGESTQGAGAVAMVVAKNPKIAVINDVSTFLTEDIMDFWRPIKSDYAFADGKFSTEKYMSFFSKVWSDYVLKTEKTFADFKAICFHQPFTKLGYKALAAQMETDATDDSIKTQLLANYEFSKTYNKRVGNIYTGSLYLSLISLLESSDKLKSGDLIGLFSYGSGAVGEFFTLTLQNNYENYLRRDDHIHQLNARVQLSVEEYEERFLQALPELGKDVEFSLASNETAPFIIERVQNNQRIYSKNL